MLEDKAATNATEIALLKKGQEPFEKFTSALLELKDEFHTFKARVLMVASAPGVLVAAIEVWRALAGK